MQGDYTFNNNNNNVHPTNGTTNNQSQKRRRAPLPLTSSNARPRNDNYNNASNFAVNGNPLPWPRPFIPNNNNTQNTPNANNYNNANNSAVNSNPLPWPRPFIPNNNNAQNTPIANNYNNASNFAVNGNLLPPPLQNNNNTQNTPAPIKYYATIASGLNKSIQLEGSLNEIISEIANRSIFKGNGCLRMVKTHIHFKVDMGCVFGFEGEWDMWEGRYKGQFARTKNGLQAHGSGEWKKDGFVLDGEFIYYPHKNNSELLNGKFFYNGTLPWPQFPDMVHGIGTMKNGMFEGFFQVLGPEWRITGETNNKGTVDGKKWYKSSNTVLEGEFQRTYPFEPINAKQSYFGEWPPKKYVGLKKFEKGKLVEICGLLPNGDLVNNIREFPGGFIGKKETASEGQIIDNKLEGNWVKYINCANGGWFCYDGLFKDDKFIQGIIYTPEGDSAVKGPPSE